MAPLRFLGEWREHAIRMAKGEGDKLDPFFDGSGEAAIDLKPNSEYLKELNARPLPKIPITIIAGKTDKKFEDRFSDDSAVPEEDQSAWEAFKISVKQKWVNVFDEIGDGVVSLDSTKLEGVSDWIVVQGNHHTILKNTLSKKLPPAVEIVRDIVREVMP
jgi:hypothetical protein